MKQHTENAYQRKKQPERVRAQLLEASAHMILAQGVAGLTLDAVAQMAGVSKGGLLHHFASKTCLLATAGANGCPGQQRHEKRSPALWQIFTRLHRCQYRSLIAKETGPAH